MTAMEKAILSHLEKAGAILTGRHFVFTKGGHGTAYINMREVAHDTAWLMSVARQIVLQIGSKADIVIGPETLGRTLAELTAAESGKLPGIWCGFEGEGNDKRAVFAANLNFGRLLAGKHVAIVDDLLTTGSSVKLVSDLVLANGGIPVMVVVVVRRTPEISHKECHVLELDVLADVPGFEVFTEQQCAEYGPCSRREAITLRPGHGWKWIEDHPGYPVVDSKP